MPGFWSYNGRCELHLAAHVFDAIGGEAGDNADAAAPSGGCV